MTKRTYSLPTVDCQLWTANCGLEISSTQVSRLAKELDEQLQAFLERPLGRFEYVYPDARYEKTRHQNSVRDVAVLVAWRKADHQ